MRSLIRRRVADAATVLFAGALLGAAVYESLGTSTEKLALFAAAAIAAEALQRTHDELLPDALESERFSSSAPVHLAAFVVAGPWVAAVAAAWSIVAVGPFRGAAPQRVLRRAAAVGVAALAGGFAFQLAGGVVGSLRLPDELLPVVLGGLVYVTARTLFEGAVAGRAALPDLVTSAAEIGFGVVLAFAALRQVWLVVALAPVLVLVERLHARVIGLRREMATALETFANIVDERDPSTYGHSLRVAHYVSELARALGLPRTEVQRLWWVGRLHDLGKVAVDAAVLSKPGKLSPAEWGTVWRAPRLSSRLLQRFGFASPQAQAVEYHRERHDGTGYYRVSRENIPLAADFLILADAYDAMTTEKPFRARLDPEEALAEIERGSGSQFHPVIAKAFAAVQRGQDPTEVLAREELAMIRDASGPSPSAMPSARDVLRRPEVMAVVGCGTLLVGFGTGLLPVAVAGAAFALAGLKFWHGARRRVSRLAGALADTMSRPADHPHLFGDVVDVIDKVNTWPLVYAALVAWNEDGSGGSIRLQRGAHRPPESAIVSWLLRQAESGSGVVVDDGAELASVGAAVALPLRRDNSSLIGFLVFCSQEHPPAHVLPALERCVDDLGLAFSESPPAEVLRFRRKRIRALDPRRRRHARALEG
jgi:HD-GYP domain-containing protein (c-di-GMP phosphodiesterase class II)